MKKKTKFEDTISNDLWECVVELLQGVLNLLLLNPLIYPLLTLFIPKVIIGFACKHTYSIMWNFVSIYSTHSGKRNRYWFHYHTKLAYADLSEQVWVVGRTKKEEDFYKIYHSENVNPQVKSFGFWQNPELSENFRVYMLKEKYTLSLSDFEFVLDKKQYLVMKEILKQTISEEQCIILWNKVLFKSGKEILDMFQEYVVREGITPRVKAYVSTTYSSLARYVIMDALQNHEAVICVKQCKSAQTFEQLLATGMEFPYEAQCCLSVDFYKVYKKKGYELCEKAVIHHLKKEGEMAKEILFEQREFTADQTDVIMKSSKLTSWFNKKH
ncbi:MAG: hypothetical protein IKC10_04785 [Alphaproteobacteria bacterium]|nr:hypothetical protein [Alphaproteobacteria bacterium]